MTGILGFDAREDSNDYRVRLDGARKGGESEERLATLAAWRDTPHFSEAERAALALTESLTLVGHRAEPVKRRGLE